MRTASEQVEFSPRVRLWLNAYHPEKEREFIKYIERDIPEDKIDLLDVGCGIALHSQLWRERNKRVTASDINDEFGNYVVHAYDFPFIYLDVLNCSISDKFDICFCMAIGTILHEEAPRFRTFEVLAKLLREGSFLVLITHSKQWLFAKGSRRNAMHALDERDIAKLQDLGLNIRRVFYWSNSPKFLWRSPGLRVLARCAEYIGSHLGIGARKVLICQQNDGKV